MSAPEVRFGVLGSLLVEADGAAVSLPRSSVLRSLLGVMLLAEGRPVPVERLVDLVWTEQADQIGRGRVQTGVSRLRDWLTRLGSDDISITFDGGGYRLDVPADAVDLGRFRALAESAASPSMSAADRCRLLGTAFALWRGPALSNLAALNRSDPLLQSVELTIRDAGLALAEAAMAAHLPEQAVPTLSTLIAENPLDETLQAKLIELLAAEGRPAEALRRYDELRRKLADDLGVEPGERAQRAYLAVLDRDRPLSAIRVVPAQLPPDVADFTGRGEQAMTVAGLVSNAGEQGRPVRVAVIAGMAGIGKTALAIHIGHDLIDEFPEGQLYADLRGASSTVADPYQVLGGFLLALGIEGAVIPDTLDGRVGLYRSLLAGRRVLIVLDNAASEQQVRALLPGAPGCSVLVTGRTPLAGLEAAQVVVLDEFDQREGVELLTRIVGAERVAAEPEAAAEIVRLCGLIPLAVRIAGARLAARPKWSLARLAVGLEDERHRLSELTAGDLAVGASLHLSYTRLEPAARRVFRLLGPLRVPDFAAWVVAAVAGKGADGLDAADDVSVEALIESLIDAQLLTIARTDSTGELRYRFHDLVRLYARERCRIEDSPEVREAAFERYFGAFLWLCERASERVPGPCYAAIHGSAPRYPVAGRLLDDAMAWFDAEREALPAVVRQACDLGMDELAWDFASCLEKYFDVRNLYDDWRRTHQQVLALCRAAGNRLGEAVLLRGLIEVTTWSISDHEGAAMIALYDRATDLVQRFRALGEDRGTADALVMCAWGLIAKGAEEQALDTAREALALAESRGHLGGQARAQHVMAIAYGEGRPEIAAAHLETALALTWRLGNRRFEATVLQFLGAARCLMGDIGAGEELLRKSLDIARNYSDHYVEAFSLLYLAKLYAALGDPRAWPTAETVLDLSRRYTLRHHLADSLRLLGELDLAAGRARAAVRRLSESVQVWRSRGWLKYLADTLRSLGHAHLATGDDDSARQVWLEARELYEQLADTVAMDEMGELLSEVATSAE